MGTVETCLASGELAQAFLVLGGEVLMEFDEGLLGNRVDMPGVTGNDEDASGLKHEKGEVFDCIIG